MTVNKKKFLILILSGVFMFSGLPVTMAKNRRKKKSDKNTPVVITTSTEATSSEHGDNHNNGNENTNIPPQLDDTQKSDSSVDNLEVDNQQGNELLASNPQENIPQENNLQENNGQIDTNILADDLQRNDSDENDENDRDNQFFTVLENSQTNNEENTETEDVINVVAEEETVENSEEINTDTRIPLFAATPLSMGNNDNFLMDVLAEHNIPVFDNNPENAIRRINDLNTLHDIFKKVGKKISKKHLDLMEDKIMKLTDKEVLESNENIRLHVFFMFYNIVHEYLLYSATRPEENNINFEVTSPNLQSPPKKEVEDIGFLGFKRVKRNLNKFVEYLLPASFKTSKNVTEIVDSKTNFSTNLNNISKVNKTKTKYANTTLALNSYGPLTKEEMVNTIKTKNNNRNFVNLSTNSTELAVYAPNFNTAKKNRLSAFYNSFDYFKGLRSKIYTLFANNKYNFQTNDTEIANFINTTVNTSGIISSNKQGNKEKSKSKILSSGNTGSEIQEVVYNGYNTNYENNKAITRKLKSMANDAVFLNMKDRLEFISHYNEKFVDSEDKNTIGVSYNYTKKHNSPKYTKDSFNMRYGRKDYSTNDNITYGFTINVGRFDSKIENINVDSNFVNLSLFNKYNANQSLSFTGEIDLGVGHHKDNKLRNDFNSENISLKLSQGYRFATPNIKYFGIKNITSVVVGITDINSKSYNLSSFETGFYFDIIPVVIPIDVIRNNILTPSLFAKYNIPFSKSEKYESLHLGHLKLGVGSEFKINDNFNVNLDLVRTVRQINSGTDSIEFGVNYSF